MGPARGLPTSDVGFTNPDGALVGRPIRRALHPPLEGVSHDFRELPYRVVTFRRQLALREPQGRSLRRITVGRGGLCSPRLFPCGHSAGQLVGHCVDALARRRTEVGGIPGPAPDPRRAVPPESVVAPWALPPRSPERAARAFLGLAQTGCRGYRRTASKLTLNCLN